MSIKPKHSITIILLFLAALSLIFGLTLQNSQKSAELSQNVQQFLQTAFERLGIRTNGLRILTSDNHHFRKYAHTAEFFLLGIACALLFRRSKHGFWKALLFCAVISLTDQSLKFLVPGREFDFTDFPYDAIGYVTAALLARILSRFP